MTYTFPSILVCRTSSPLAKSSMYSSPFTWTSPRDFTKKYPLDSMVSRAPLTISRITPSGTVRELFPWMEISVFIGTLTRVLVGSGSLL